MSETHLNILTWGGVILMLFCAFVLALFCLLILANMIDDWFKARRARAQISQGTPVMPITDPTCECGCKNFYSGPQGGMMTNISCADCGTWYNICPELGIFDKLDKPKEKVS